MKNWLKWFESFWSAHPALYWGLLFCVNFAIFTTYHPLFLLLLIYLLFTASYSLTKVFASILLCITNLAYLNYHYKIPTIPPYGLQGSGYLQIDSIQLKSSFQGKQWVYKGFLKNWTCDNHLLAKNIPVNIFIPHNTNINRPVANKDYYVYGKIYHTKSYSYTFYPQKNKPWQTVNKSYSWAEKRYEVKESIKKYFSTLFTSKRDANFLSGIFLGEQEDPLLSFHFNRFGLQHILAVSGFHFGIIAFLLQCSLRTIFKVQFVFFSVILLITFYFILLGLSPSVLRAWIAIIAILIANRYGLCYSSLNILGIGLLTVIFIDPFYIYHLGFQFSFLTTSAILIFYPPFDSFLEKVLPKRFLNEALDLKVIHQLVYIVLQWIRKGIALSFAVNIATFPLTLYHFSKFPILSLVYNLFFPLCISIIFFLIFLLILSHILLFPMKSILLPICEKLVHSLLATIYNYPIQREIYLSVKKFSFIYLLLLLTITYTLGVFLYYKRKEQEKNIFFT
ncbi:ComEC/Rec2-related protein [Candidatus Rubidus massiliensis]|nr:ComEC/Rec2-related protein [Candidatus Rubidus massiliensis]